MAFLRDTNLFPLKKSSPHWRGKCFSVQKPEIIGSYSLQDDGIMVNSLKNMRYLCLPDEGVHIDLNIGFEDRSEEPPVEKQINDLLSFIVAHSNKMKIPVDHPDSKAIFPDFVCRASLLTQLMRTPFEFIGPRNEFDGWQVMATKYRGTIYLHWEEKCLFPDDDDPKTRPFYYGSKYRHMITTYKFNEPPDLMEPVSRGNFYVSFKSRIGRHQIFYTEEIYGVQSDRSLGEHEDLTKIPVKLIEMHTSIATIKKQNFLRYKLKHFWTRTFLTGIETVYCGHRTPEGVVESIEEIPVKEMPKMAASEWSDAVCVKFATAFLDLVKTEMKDIDSPDTVFLFTYDPYACSHVQYEILSGENKLSFLPSWYLDFLDGLVVSEAK